MTVESSRLADAALDAAQGRRPDEDFLALAYRLLLGREADPAGYVDGLRQLRRGVDRLSMMLVLARSSEAQAYLGQPLGPELVQSLQRLAPGRKGAVLLRAFKWFRTSSAPASRLTLEPDGEQGKLPAPSAGATRATGHQWPVRRQLCVVTIATQSYLPQVRTLAASVAQHHPASAFVCVLVGASDSGIDAASLGLTDSAVVFDASGLGVPCFDDMTIRYETVELCTALKPWALLYLIEDCQFDTAIYLDPDIELYAPMSVATAALNAGATVTVTPHVLQPLTPAGMPDDHAILKSGVFNLGFIAIRREADALAFLRWWAQQLRTRCLVDFESNLFTDQRWCDLLPCFIASLEVVRHPGYNVAYWNLDQRPLEFGPDGQWTACGEPLVFFHFSGFDPLRPEQCSRHQTRLGGATLKAVAPLLNAYAATLKARGWPESNGSNHYDWLSPGQPMPALLRQFYRWRHPLPLVGSRAELLQSLTADAATPGKGLLPNLLVFLHASRADLKVAFDLNDAEDASDFMQWVRCCAGRQMNLAGLLRLD